MDITIYFIYTLGLYFGINIQEQYLDRNQSQILPVMWYDVIFSISTLTICILLVSQYIHYGDGEKIMSNSSKVWAQHCRFMHCNPWTTGIDQSDILV